MAGRWATGLFCRLDGGVGACCSASSLFAGRQAPAPCCSHDLGVSRVWLLLVLLLLMMMLLLLLLPAYASHADAPSCHPLYAEFNVCCPSATDNKSSCSTLQLCKQDIGAKVQESIAGAAVVASILCTCTICPCMIPCCAQCGGIVGRTAVCTGRPLDVESQRETCGPCHMELVAALCGGIVPVFR